MKESKAQVEQAVITIGESLSLKEAIPHLLKSAGLYETIKEIVYISFVKDKQPYFEKDTTVFEAYSLIREYCKEMSDNGEVRFDISFDSDEYIKSINSIT